MFDNIRTFELKDLQGKTLKMHYSEDGGVEALMGIDEETGEVYILISRYKRGEGTL
jgi:hypothetical protein